MYNFSARIKIWVIELTVIKGNKIKLEMLENLGYLGYWGSAAVSKFRD